MDLWTNLYGVIEESLYSLCTALPRIVRQGTVDKADAAFVQLRGIIRSLGCEGMRKICLSHAHVKRLFLALCQVIEFDVQRIPVVSEMNSEEVLSPGKHTARHCFYFVLKMNLRN